MRYIQTFFWDCFCDLFQLLFFLDNVSNNLLICTAIKHVAVLSIVCALMSSSSGMSVAENGRRIADY